MSGKQGSPVTDMDGVKLKETSSSSLKTRDLEAIALGGALLMDLAWILKCPMLAISSLTAAFYAQSRLVKASACGGNQIALLGWLCACFPWLVGEMLWDSDQAVGMLTLLHAEKFRTTLYAPTLMVGCLIMWMSVALVIRNLLWTQQQPQQLEEGRYLLPWIVMESLWITFDLQVILPYPGAPLALTFYAGAAAGAWSLLACGAAIASKRALEKHRDALWCSCDLSWIAGNFIWFVFDYAYRPASEPGRVHIMGWDRPAACVFAMGLLMVLFAYFAPPDGSEERRLVNADA